MISSINLIKEKIAKRTLFIVITVMMMAGALSGCSASGKSPSKNPFVEDIWAGIKQSVDVSDMAKLDGKKLQRLYGIKPEDAAEFCVYTSLSNIKADEIAIVKVKDTKNNDSIKSKILERVKKQENSFKDYLPGEYSLIKGHVLKSKNNYVLFVVSKDADKIEDIFDGFMN